MVFVPSDQIATIPVRTLQFERWNDPYLYLFRSVAAPPPATRHPSSITGRQQKNDDFYIYGIQIMFLLVSAFQAKKQLKSTMDGGDGVYFIVSTHAVTIIKF